MDAETDKWNSTMNDENNDIVKRAKNMSAMAYSMYQFTKGEGALRTTQDLFTQAEYFAEEANRLYKVVRQFSYQVGDARNLTSAIKLMSVDCSCYFLNRCQLGHPKRSCSINLTKFQHMFKPSSSLSRSRPWANQRLSWRSTTSYRKLKIWWISYQKWCRRALTAQTRWVTGVRKTLAPTKVKLIELLLSFVYRMLLKMKSYDLN